KVPLGRAVVLGQLRPHDRGALLVAGATAAERLEGCLGLPTLKDVDPAWLDEVGRQREVETAGRPAGLAHHLDESGQVVVTLSWVDDYLSCHNDHEILLLVRCCRKQDDMNLREAREASLDTLTPQHRLSSVTPAFAADL